MTHFISALEAMDIARIMGVAGFLCYVGNYIALSFRWLTSECIGFFIINTFAATMVLISLTRDFNLASAMIQVFWIVIGLTAIAIRLWRGPKRTPSSHSCNVYPRSGDDLHATHVRHPQFEQRRLADRARTKRRRQAMPVRVA